MRDANGNWINSKNLPQPKTKQYFVSCMDGVSPRPALLLGPFTTEAACKQYAYRTEDGGDSAKFQELQSEVLKVDRKAHFYTFGMVALEDTKNRGILNRLFPDKWGKVLS